MSKNLFTFAFATAVISGFATGTGGDLAGFTPIAMFLMYGASVWIGWNCVNSSHAKDYAVGAAALVFLNAPAWGNASSVIGQVQWIGQFLAPVFNNMVFMVVLIAAVGMLKSLYEGARSAAHASA